MLDFTKMDIAAVMSGVDTDGERYLKKFLQEYTAHFGGTVNPSCPKCLSDYLIKYKKIMAKNTPNTNNSGYVLLKKYENIPLEFGSPILVNNSNLTDEYAKQLLKREDGKRYFETLPAAEAKPKKAEVKKEKAPEAPKEEAKPEAPKKEIDDTDEIL